MISPSLPYIGEDLPSDKTAHFTPFARSRTPMSFSPIGGNGGGPAGGGAVNGTLTAGVERRPRRRRRNPGLKPERVPRRFTWVAS